MNTKYFCAFYIIISTILSPILFPLLLTPVDNDVFFHLSMVRNVQENLDFFPRSINWLNAPDGIDQFYPLFFHWLFFLLSFCGFFDLINITILFQILAFPCALTSLYFLSKHIHGEQKAFIAVVIASTFFPFFSRTHNCIPESIQHILIPLTVLFYLKKNVKLCGVLITIQFLNHFLDPFLVLLFITIDKVINRKTNKSSLFFIYICAFPGIAVQIYWLTLKQQIYTINNAYAAANTFWPEITLNALLPSLILMILVVVSIVKENKKRKYLIIYLWILSLLSIFFLNYPSRFPAYFAIPASILISTLIDQNITDFSKIKFINVALLLLISICLSFIFFGHRHDLQYPSVSVAFKDAVLWIKNFTPENSIISVNPGRTLYDGVKIYYLTRRRVTENLAYSNFHFSNKKNASIENWNLIEIFDDIYIYERKMQNDLSQ